MPIHARQSRSQRSRSRAARIALAVLAAGALTFTTTAPGGAAALRGVSWVASGNGVIGVQQTVILKAPKLKNQVATITFSTPGGAQNSGQAAVNSSGFAYLNWTPNIAGNWTITAASGGTTIDTAVVTVAAMPTQTTLLIQGEVQRNTNAGIVVQTRALGGVIAPSGTVTVKDQYGNTVTSGSLTPSGVVGESVANLTWTSAASSLTMTATYTPDTTAFAASTSNTQAPAVGSAIPISIRMPSNLYVGVPVEVSAVANANYLNSSGGSVAFNLSQNGFMTYPMGGSHGMVNGTGSTSWTPTNVGYQTVIVQYASLNLQYNGDDSQVVFVNPAPTPDAITVTPSGGSAWAPGAVGAVTAGGFVTITPTSTSGNPVSVSVAGPCALEAADITFLAAGQCTVTATSLGNGTTLSPSSAEYTVTINAAAKKKKKK